MFFKKKKQVDKDVIAYVNDEYLYVNDVKPLTRGLKGKDSTEAIKNYAENWVRHNLLLQKAMENIPGDDITITQKVENYRNDLILYEYEKALINQKLDTVIKPEEMNEWYEKLKDGFPLDNDVYLLFFIKLKKDAPDLDKARKWVIKPKDEEDLRKLEGYCKEFATSYVMDKGMWYEGDKLLQNFPLNAGDINSMSNSKTFREFKTDDGDWFIKIADVMKKGQLAPLELIHTDIEKAIIEERRQQLIKRTYDMVYMDGIKSKAFEIFVK